MTTDKQKMLKLRHFTVLLETLGFESSNTFE